MVQPHPTSPGGPGRVHLHDANPTKNVPWYIPTIKPALMSPPLVNLLENYASIPPSSKSTPLPHPRPRLGGIPMPSVELFWWLVLGFSTHPHYPSLLTILKSPPTDTSKPRLFLDLGTCLGQDSRKLIHNGIPPSSVYGSDIFPGYESVGHALFNDTSTTRGQFITADILMNHLLRLWVGKGSIIIGAQRSSMEDIEEVLSAPFLKDVVEKKVFRPSKETFQQMWQDAAEELRIKVRFGLSIDRGGS
ncbi:hypothetical protein BDZ45DRAFT_737120 [Acephala macrosclerotiorum]|nr:hypothetical protein BDZ45DRAFT_737120 [Acephala macrosclerotiorum]